MVYGTQIDHKASTVSKENKKNDTTIKYDIWYK